MSRLRRWALLALGAFVVSRLMSRRKERAVREEEKETAAREKAA